MKNKIIILFVSSFAIILAASIVTAGDELDEFNYLPHVVYEEPPTATPLPTATAVPTATSTPIPTSEPPPTGCNTCSFDAYNCSDFSRQRDAQACHDYCMEQVGFDVHRLDRDGDGRVCESLP